MFAYIYRKKYLFSDIGGICLWRIKNGSKREQTD